MERKIIKQGERAFTVSLPIHWIRKHNLKAKDAIHIEEKNNSLEISTALRAPVTEAHIDLRKKSRLSTLHTIISKYIQGYDTIHIQHDSLTHVQEAAGWLMGMAIEDYQSHKCTLRSIVEVPQTDVKKQVTKITHILNQQAKTLVEIAKGSASMEKILSEEKLIDTHTLYCLRYLTKYTDQKRGYGQFLICSSFDMISDMLTELAEHIGKDVKEAERISKCIHTYTSCLIKNDFETANKHILKFSAETKKKTFLQGMTFSLGEIVYNYLGFIIEEFNSQEHN